jgi:GNAT superfamily N-acetyltransferase
MDSAKQAKMASPAVDPAGFGHDLLKSDADYFRAAACREQIDGCELLHMPGLTSLAAGCVVLTGGAESHDALDAVEARLAELDCGHARLYQQQPDDELEEELVKRGYQRAEEIGMLHVIGDVGCQQAPSSRVQLRPVESETDWALKRSLYSDIRRGPDGHSADADLWVQLERCKCEAGYMEPFLIYSEDLPCGAVSFAAAPRLGRLKNLVVHPRWRRRGIGLEAARAIIRLAGQRGLPAAGVFALEKGPSQTLYQDAGYAPFVRQIEWWRKLK